jgi:taurine-pyruvate aminotransferase
MAMDQLWGVGTSDGSVERGNFTPDREALIYFGSPLGRAEPTAIKIARAYWLHTGWPRRTTIVGISNGWHGCSLGALSASGVVAEQAQFRPLAAGFRHLLIPADAVCTPSAFEETTAYATRALEALIEYEEAETIAAVIAEPI